VNPRGAAAPAWSAAEGGEPQAVSARLAEQGVSLEAEEVTLLERLLGRPPSRAEAVLFGVLWSEQRSCKSTRHLLGRLPTRAPQVILGAGEAAGVVALPAPCEDLALVLAHGSHNHPSQLSPVEGAATGIGGVVREVGCTGAEVVGALDALRFGDPRGTVHARDVARGVVQGVADYANAVGVPNLGGDVAFDAGFDQHCLVNVMAVGFAPRSGILPRRVPEGPGPWAFVLVGRPTDEGGSGGAAFAPGGQGREQRGSVPPPDPLLERVLHVANAEACRRIRERGVPAGFTDLGAGGVACAAGELAAAGGRGAELELDLLHRVARAVPPEVLLCADTPERYCWVVPESFAPELVGLYNQTFALGAVCPGAGASIVGRVRDDTVLRVTWQGEALVDCPLEAITTERRIVRPARRRPPAARARSRERRPDPHGALLTLLSSFALGSREYLFRHYDTEVQGRTWLRPGEGDAAVIRAHPGRPTGIAFAVGGNPCWCAGDPELGARHAVAEAARNVACVGARPWALTQCLNFGHPGDPVVMGDLEATLEGLAVAAEALGGLAARGQPLPYVSGNVSLYNQTAGRAIPPSPIVLCAGMLRDVGQALGLAASRPGDFLVLAGEPRVDLNGSVYLREVLKQESGGPPALDLEREARLQDLAVAAAEGGWVRAAHDVSDGGLAVALAEMLGAAPRERGLGLDVDLGVLETEAAPALFCERSGIVFEVSPERAARLFQAARERSLLAWPIGAVSAGGGLRMRTAVGVLEWTAEELAAAAARPLERLWNEEIG
jgi:phosphoribosylformylglycinamidine synthase